VKKSERDGKKVVRILGAVVHTDINTDSGA
jgi:hypothetical protein